MKKAIFKSVASLGTFASALYWGGLPVLATDQNIDLCSGNNASRFCFNSSVSDIVSTVVNLVLFVAFVAALIFLIIGGIRWIMSGGDKEGSGKAKETVTSALIGLAVVLGAWILINIVISTFTGGSLSNVLVPSLTP